MSTTRAPAEAAVLRRTWVNPLACRRLYLNLRKENEMFISAIQRAGRIRWGIAAWLLGLPLPIVIIAFLAYGCN
jgi:hypothetical protein